MAAWNTDDLDRIGAAEEVRMTARRADGPLRKPVIVWAVRAGNGGPHPGACGTRPWFKLSTRLTESSYHRDSRIGGRARPTARHSFTLEKLLAFLASWYGSRIQLIEGAVEMAKASTAAVTTGYRMKCMTQRTMTGAKPLTMKNGRPATEGSCPECGTKMFKIGAAK